MLPLEPMTLLVVIICVVIAVFGVMAFMDNDKSDK